MSPGVYVHVPFCARLCPYCAFPVAVGHDQDQEAYVRAVLAEAAARSGELPEPAGSLHLGGGTPSRLEPKSLGSLVSGLRKALPFRDGFEFAIEANPEDVTPARADLWRELGANRVSLGAQSFDKGELAALGRVHGPERIAQSVGVLKEKGLANVNLDLIAGAGKGWRASLQSALALEPAHLSVYILEYEPGTALSRNPGWSRWTEDQEGDLILETRPILEAAGFEWYELSNFARPGRRSVYNDGFWKGGEVLGLGPGAASSRGTLRRRNRRSLALYLADPLQAEEREDLDPWGLAAESLLRGLRCLDGAELSGLELGPLLLEEARGKAYAPYLTVRGTRLVPSPRGRLVADALARDLMPVRGKTYINNCDSVAAG